MIMLSKFSNFPNELSENDELREYELSRSDCTPEDPDLTSDDDLDAESNDDGIAANEYEIIHTNNQFLRILDQMKAYALRNQLSWEAHANIDNLSSILVQSKVQVARIQTDISTYFNSPKR